MDSHFNIRHIMPQKHTDIKVDFHGASFSITSPPTTPSDSLSPATTCRSGSTSSLAGPVLNPEPSLHKEELVTMSNSPWSSNARPHHPSERKLSDGDKLCSYTTPQFMNDSYLPHMPGGSDLGSVSSSSSLTGAMGESTVHSRRSGPLPSSSSRRVYANAQHIMWDNSAQPNMPINTSYPTTPGHGSLSFAEMNSSLITMDEYRNNPTPVSPHSPNYGYSTQPPGNNGIYQAMSPYPSPSTPEVHGDDEVLRLRRRVRELEAECNRNRGFIEPSRRSVTAGLPTPSPSPSFQASWRTRTEARKRIFCSLNRAGNALCAWHDSRRERRTYAPRQAPPGYLNCGCSFEEALFEESLSRNNVGSYLPGEAVRMDPALRNPLLQLLEKRYGYKDGDFERDPHTECWIEGESPSDWERKAQSGHPIRRRTDTDRH